MSSNFTYGHALVRVRGRRGFIARLAGAAGLLAASPLLAACDALAPGAPTPLPPAGSSPTSGSAPTNPGPTATPGSTGVSSPLAQSAPSPSQTPLATTGPAREYVPVITRPGTTPAAGASPTAGATAYPPPAVSTPVPARSATPPASATPTQPPPPTQPPASPTPRQPVAKSALQRLQDYPRPAGDSGYGFHINADPSPPKREVLQGQVIPLLNALGATWVTMYVSSADVREWLDLVRLIVEAKIEVVVRYHFTNAPPHPDFVPTLESVQRFRDIGIRYLVTGNEPNLGLENPSRSGPGAVARQWVQASDRIKAGGCVPLLYPMSPGGRGSDVDSREMLVGMLDWLKANNALDSLDGAAVAIHNRPHGKPLEVRDSTSFLEYEWIDDTVASYAGKHLPLLGTEAGYAFGEQVLANYPRIDGELHKQYNLGIITGFRDARWRDALFTQTFWILSGFGSREFISDWWVENPLNFGKDLPVIEALKALPKFTRRFQGSGFVTKPR